MLGRTEQSSGTGPTAQADSNAPEQTAATTGSRLESLQLSDNERRQIRGGRSFGGVMLRLFFLLLVVAGLLVPIGMYKQGLLGAVEVPAVRVTADDRQGIVLTLSGVIVPATSVNITSIVPGKIVEFPVDEGSRVEKGDLLALVEQTGFRADHAEAQAALTLAESRLRELQNGALPEEIEKVKAQLAEAEAKYEFAAKDLSRAKRLDSKNALSPANRESKGAVEKQAGAVVEQLKQELKLVEQGAREEVIAAAEAEVQGAKAKCDKAAFYLEQTEVKAPVDGTILERNANLGEITRSDYLPTTLCVLADLTQMEAEVDVQERELEKITVGQICRIYPDAYSSRMYIGKVTRFQPQVNRQRGVVKTTITLDAPDEYLLAEMNCRVEFLDESPQEDSAGLRVPDEAVVRSDDEATVFVLESNVVAERTVEVGEVNAAGMLEVKGGLFSGDVVLIPGDIPLRVGQHVKPKFL